MLSAVCVAGFDASASAAINTLHVSPTGADIGNCVASPCKTIQYAVNQAVAGDTVRVGKGTYHETVAITKAIQLVGAGEATTTIDGQGLDTTGPVYGVVYVGNVGGAASVSGFTITNPFPFSYTGGEPEVVALADPSASDSVVITNDVISEGSADVNASTDFPIGIDTFNNVATTTITHDTVAGTFQGALFEDNGPISFAHNAVKNLIAATADATVYPAEGVFFLSDLGGSLTGQNASNNRFSSYSGYGIIMEAGYNNGNCTATPCNGSISGSISHNHLALQGGATAVGIDLESKFNGNNLTASVTSNSGFVTSPSQAIFQASTDGATISVTESGNKIKVRS